ncbi:MAG: hypothetical protein WCP58_08690 [bacterium]
MVSPVCFAAVLDLSLPEAIPPQERWAERMVHSSLPPPSIEKIGGYCDGLDWCGSIPPGKQALSTWSFFQDTKFLCWLEGEFYDASWGYRPIPGNDSCLARLLGQHWLEQGESQLNQLNGVFSGFLYQREERTLHCFVDPVGVRPLYFYQRGGRSAVCSNLFGLYAWIGPVAIDRLALREQLLLGQPLRSRTLLEGVTQVPPGKVVTMSTTGSTHRRYFFFPTRESDLSLHEGVERISLALEGYVRRFGVGPGEWALALSGGKDSRTILSALLFNGASPRAYCFSRRDESMDAQITPALCRKAGIPLTMVPTDEVDSSLILFSEVAVLLEGISGFSPFLLLACKASERERILMTGCNGGPMSGDFGGFYPWVFQSPTQLAEAWWQWQPLVMPESLVDCCLHHNFAVSGDEVRKELEVYYQDTASELGDMTSSFRMFDMENKRICLLYQMMRIFLTPVHPLADRALLDVFLRLPLTHLVDRRAHSLAAMRRYPIFGRIPTAPSGLPLLAELHLHFALSAYRAYRRRRGKQRARLYTSILEGRLEALPPASVRHSRMAAILEQSDLFDQEALRTISPFLVSGQLPGLPKLASTAIFLARIRGKELPAAPPPFFLSSGDGDRQ